MSDERPHDLEAVMHFDPDEGVTDLDSHLDRLKCEADSLGYAFDRHAARNELQAATFGKRHEATARLVVSPAGSIAIQISRA